MFPFFKGGGFLKPKMLREIPDPVTGYPLRHTAERGKQVPTTGVCRASGSLLNTSFHFCYNKTQYKD